MKKLLVLLFCLVLCAALTAGILIGAGIVAVQDLITDENLNLLQATLEDTAQLARDKRTQLYEQLADHQPPSGDGELLEGELPADHVPDASSLYSFPADRYPYRAMLTDTEQDAYDQVYANAVELYEQLPLHTPISTSSISRVMNAVFYDHPELFWLETAYQYSYNYQDSVVAVTLVYNDTARDIETNRARFDAVVNQILSDARMLDDAVQQEKYVHDYLLDNVSYRLDSPLNQSAYSALIYGESVCAGYARAFQHLMLELGIPCYYCAGYAGEAHAWNIIRLDDGYYHVDVAWNDPIGNETGQRFYNYFNLSDKEIEEDHTRTDLSVNLPACNGTAYRYEAIFGALEDANAPAAGGRLPARSPEEAGFDRREAITTIRAYYTHCEDALVELGAGVHSFSMLLRDQDLLERIFIQTENSEAMEQYVTPAAERLRLAGYTANVSLQAESLRDGYWLLTQDITLLEQGQEGPPATDALAPLSGDEGTEAPQQQTAYQDD